MTTDSTEKAKALAQALGQIEKHYGKGAIMRLGKTKRSRCPSSPAVPSA